MVSRLLFLHPGAMGASIAAVLVEAGHDVRWVAEGRGSATRQRAQEAGLVECATLREGLAGVDVVFSVCPPVAAGDVATSVVQLGFAGTYVDANAISPATTRRIAVGFGPSFVDGGIIGPPVAGPGTTRLYLSGPTAAPVAALFDGTVLDARVVDEFPGSASALKMCYAAWTKGTAALLIAIRALAASEGVTDRLLEEWEMSIPDLVERTEAIGPVGLKAWRFAPEMDEIARTFGAADLPTGFHDAAAEIYRRLAGFKDADPPPSLRDLVALTRGEPPDRKADTG